MKLIYIWKPLLECKIVTNRCVSAWRCENKSTLRVHVELPEFRHFARTTCHSTLAYLKAKRWECHGNYEDLIMLSPLIHISVCFYTRNISFVVCWKTEWIDPNSFRAESCERMLQRHHIQSGKASLLRHSRNSARIFQEIFHCRVNLFHFRNDINSIPRKANLAPQLTFDVSRLDFHPSRWSSSRADQMKFAEFCSPWRGFSSQAFWLYGCCCKRGFRREKVRHSW